jgi:O-antigen/teichoic acid export membrane protein
MTDDPKVALVPDAVGTGFARRSSVANTLYGFGLQATSAAFTITLTFFLVRRLSHDQFGILGTAAAVGGLVLLPAEFGLGSAAGRYVSQHHRRSDAVTEIVRTSFTLTLLLTGATCVGLVLAAPLASIVGMPSGLVWPIRIAAAVVFAQSLMTISVSIFNALGRVDLNLWIYLTESLVETALAVVLVLAGAGAVGALAGRATGFAVAAAAAFLIVRRLVPHARPGGLRTSPWTRRLLGYGGALLIVDSAFALFSQIDVLLLSALRSSAAVATFAAPMRFAAFLLLPAGALTGGVAYRFGRREDWPSETASFLRAARHVLVAQGLMVAPLLVWATPLADVLFGRDAYRGSVSVLRAIVPFVVLSGFGNLFSLTANYLGQARRRVPIAVVTVVVNTGIDLVLIPHLGPVGGAIGTDVAYALYAPAHALICFRVLAVSPRPLLLPALGVAAASAGMCLVLLAFGTGHLSLPRLVLGAAASLTAYFTLVGATGAINREERRRLGRWARRAVPSRPRRPGA